MDGVPDRDLISTAPGLHPDEGRYFLQLCQAALLITVPTAQHQAQIVSTVASIIVDVTGSSKPEGAGFVLQPGGKTLINAEKGFVLLYTSGTTGPPKGVLHSRRAAEIGFVSNIKTLGLTPEDIWVHYSPVHWVGGFISMCHSILAGACVDFCSSVFSPDWLLERWEKKGQGEDGPTAMYLVPSLLESVGERLEAVRITGPLEKYELILRGLREMRVIYSGSTRVTPALRECWSNFRGGKPLMIVYGMSEAIGFVVTNDWQSNKDLPPVERPSDVHGT
jgi:acyl-CoA synthetase (AMP-forming)/AMP-acid ligase II